MPTNPKVQLVKPYPTTYVKSNPDSISKTAITPPINLIESKILQKIWRCIFNNKQDTKYLKGWDGNENHWHKAKDNWDSAISTAQCGFMLNYDYVPPEKYNPYAWNYYDLADGYIFKILDLNIPTSDSHQCRNNLKRFLKRDPNGEVFIIDGRGSWFAITAIFETTNNINSYRQVAFHKLD